LVEILTRPRGLLSSLTVAWIYEHRHFENKLERMKDQIDHVLQRLAGYDRP